MKFSTKFLDDLMKKFKGALIKWLPLGFAITAIFFFAYSLAQQNLRMAANDPQIQAVGDIVNALSQGAPMTSFSSPTPTDMSASLAPYVLLFDASHAFLAGTGQLHGITPAIPSGVFDYARSHGEDRITWEPQRGVRQAIVVHYYAGTPPVYVVVGRSLAEVEHRISMITALTEILWSVTMFGSLLLSTIVA